MKTEIGWKGLRRRPWWVALNGDWLRSTQYIGDEQNHTDKVEVGCHSISDAQSQREKTFQQVTRVDSGALIFNAGSLSSLSMERMPRMSSQQMLEINLETSQMFTPKQIPNMGTETA